ncbi:Required for respiratory growth protein 9 mitochondrial [Gnomoniopsis sp. IMI 355080]|nr:Required for respiratory growth protein 9 mitochondrial [Gnomoniopsis sp. IMI 355080]
MNTLSAGAKSSAVEDVHSTPQGVMSTAAADPQELRDERHDGVTEHTDLERVTVEEIEAEQKAQEMEKQRMRVERAKAREEKKKELAREKEEEKKRREKERLKARPDWAAQKEALKKKFPEGWRPRKKLSPDALNGIRALNQQFPDTYTTEVLANKFEVSPEAIRRILRSKWEATPEEEEERERRWHNRGVNIWQHYAAIGKKPPAKWREAGVAYQPRRGGRSDRDEPERESSGRHVPSVQQDDGADSEQIKRIKRQQNLARELL